MSSGGRVLELAVELAGDVALETPLDLAVGLAVGTSAFDVGLGGGVVSQAGQHDDVQRAVELAVTAHG